MWGKIGTFFSSFFKNIAADPVSSLKGVVSLAGAAATCYGMATGAVPVNELSIGAASALATNGIHALGTNNITGQTAPAATKLEAAVQTAGALTPTALSISDHYQAISQEAGKAQATLSALSEISAALSALGVTPALPAAPQLAAAAPVVAVQPVAAPVAAAEQPAASVIAAPVAAPVPTADQVAAAQAVLASVSPAGAATENVAAGVV